MTGFKEPSLAERQNAAANARKTALKKFRAGADDLAFAQRRANREVSAAERKARDIQKAEAKTRGAELARQAARDAAEKVARDLAEDAARGAAIGDTASQ